MKNCPIMVEYVLYKNLEENKLEWEKGLILNDRRSPIICVGCKFAQDHSEKNDIIFCQSLRKHIPSISYYMKCSIKWGNTLT